MRFALERCLEKEPANRYREIADVRVEIAKALADPDGGAAAVVGAREKKRSTAMWVPQRPPSARDRRRRCGAGWFLKPDAPAPVARFDVALPAALPQPTVPPFPLLAVSKDGTRWVVSTVRGLWVRNIGEADARPLQGITAQAAVSPTFSPDGEWLAYLDVPIANSPVGIAIRKLPVTGGTPQTVVPLTIKSQPEAIGVDVNWDERNMLTWVQPDGIMQVSANGGTPQVVVRAQDGETLASPQLLPGGDAILFTATKATGVGRWDTAEIIVQVLGSAERNVVWRGGRDARYVPTGHIVFAQGTTLFAVPFDVRRHEVTGSQTPVVEGLSTPAGGPVASDTAQYAVSDAGSLFYLTGGLVPRWRARTVRRRVPSPGSIGKASKRPSRFVPMITRRFGCPPTAARWP